MPSRQAAGHPYLLSRHWGASAWVTVCLVTVPLTSLALNAQLAPFPHQSASKAGLAILENPLLPVSLLLVPDFLKTVSLHEAHRLDLPTEHLLGVTGG